MLLSRIQCEDGPAIVVREGSEAAVVGRADSLRALAVKAIQEGRTIAETVQSRGLGEAVDLGRVAAEGRMMPLFVPAETVAFTPASGGGCGLAEITFVDQTRRVHLGWVLAILPGTLGPELLIGELPAAFSATLRHLRDGQPIHAQPLALRADSLSEGRPAHDQEPGFHIAISAICGPEALTEPGDILEFGAEPFGLPLLHPVPSIGTPLKGAPARV